MCLYYLHHWQFQLQLTFAPGRDPGMAVYFGQLKGTKHNNKTLTGVDPKNTTNKWGIGPIFPDTARGVVACHKQPPTHTRTHTETHRETVILEHIFVLILLFAVATMTHR